uniref:C2H2-type domain-containing protein n=1 Tax=Phlebotomus papatasi TaxID=29031 RepID=A0A1B0DEI2_PHLPP
MRKVHNINNRKTMCRVCGKVLSSEKSRNVHEQTHSMEKPYICTFEGCDKAFSIQYYLSRHQRIHKNEKKYKCEMCERTFRFSSTLYNHTWQYHNCTECDSKFTEHSDLLEHQKMHDAAPGNFLDKPPSKGKSRRCKTCGKLFASRSYLKTHMLTHSGIRLNKCLYCERSFRDKHVMKKHMKIHERPEKAFKCNVEDCISSFDREPDLKRHIKRYHIEFLHRCTFCSKEYKTKSHVQVHIRRDHLKEDAPLKCTQCDYKSWFSHLFRAHLKHHHQIDIASMKNYKNVLCPETDQENESDIISVNNSKRIACQEIGQDA